MCAHKFPALICRPIGAQFMDEGIIALFEFAMEEEGIRVASEKHYRLVAPSELNKDDLEKYKTASDDVEPL